MAGLAISGLIIAKELQSRQPSDLIAWERAGAGALGLSTPSTKTMAVRIEIDPTQPDYEF